MSQTFTDAFASYLDTKTAVIKLNILVSTIPQHCHEPSLNVRAGRSSSLTSDQESHFVSLLKILPDYGFDLAKLSFFD